MANRKLARKGRYGDTEIRNVAGRKSHVNKQEAKAIDLYGKLGESLVQREGAGTINPRTGIPEYHYWHKHGPHKLTADVFLQSARDIGAHLIDQTNPITQVVSQYESAFGETGFSTAGELAVDPSQKVIDPDATREHLGLPPSEDPDYSLNLTGDFDKNKYLEELTKSPEKGRQYLKSIGIPKDKLEYFESNVNLDMLGEGGFLSRQKALGLGEAASSERTAEAMYGKGGEVYTGAQAAYDIGERGRALQYGQGEEAYRIGGLGVAEARRSAQEQYGLGEREVGLGLARAGTARDLGLEAQAEARRATGEQYKMGMEQAGIGAQRSLFDVRGQQATAAGRSGLARSGAISAAGRRAQRGVFQDYTGQQKQLAEARGAAMTRADVAERGIKADYGYAQTAADISMGRLGEARTSALTGADISEAGIKSSWAGVQGMYGAGGIEAARLTEAQRSAQAGADLSYGDVFGTGTGPGERGSAWRARERANLGYETGMSNLAQTAETEFYEDLWNIEGGVYG